MGKLISDTDLWFIVRSVISGFGYVLITQMSFPSIHDVEFTFH